MGDYSAAARELNVIHAAQSARVVGCVLPPVSTCSLAVLKEGFQTIAQGIRTVKANREVRLLQIILRRAFDENWLMTRLGSFWAEHPAIALSLNLSMKSVDLVAEDMDLAMRFGKGV